MPTDRLSFVVDTIETDYTYAYDDEFCTSKSYIRYQPDNSSLRIASLSVNIDLENNVHWRRCGIECVHITIRFAWLRGLTTVRLNSRSDVSYQDHITQFERLRNIVGAMAITEWFFENTTMLHWRGMGLIDSVRFEIVLAEFCAVEGVDYERLRIGCLVRHELSN